MAGGRLASGRVAGVAHSDADEALRVALYDVAGDGGRGGGGGGGSPRRCKRLHRRASTGALISSLGWLLACWQHVEKRGRIGIPGGEDQKRRRRRGGGGKERVRCGLCIVWCVRVSRWGSAPALRRDRGACRRRRLRFPRTVSRSPRDRETSMSIRLKASVGTGQLAAGALEDALGTGLSVFSETLTSVISPSRSSGFPPESADSICALGPKRSRQQRPTLMARQAPREFLSGRLEA